MHVKGGRFLMGADPLRGEEGPPRETVVGDFWIDPTDVTNAQFARFVKATRYVTQAERALDPKAYPGLSGDQLKPSAIVFVGSRAGAGADPRQWWRVVQGADWRHPQGPQSSIQGGESLPVVQVGHADALAYARWLGRNLPTEAEWEYAARGGEAAPSTRFVWGDAPFDPKHPQANVWQGAFPSVDAGEDGYKARVAPVGCFPPNRLGLYDMAGNVWQWVQDPFQAGLDPQAGEGAGVDPGDPGSRVHIIKGGSFLCSPDFCFRYRPSARQPGPTDTGESHIGFRTVLRFDSANARHGSVTHPR